MNIKQYTCGNIIIDKDLIDGSVVLKQYNHDFDDNVCIEIEGPDAAAEIIYELSKIMSKWPLEKEN